MPAVPKHRITRHRRGGRRAHQALQLTTLVVCSHCKKPKLPHRVCPSCGYYEGVEVVEIEEAKK